MKIETLLTPYFVENEKMFDNSLVVFIDVLRASTTICAALYNGAKEVIPVESVDKAAQIYSNLSREIRLLGGERNMIKPDGFDLGNSPLEYIEEKVKSKTIILTTTNGTKAFLKAKQANIKLIGCFANQSSILRYINSILKNDFKMIYFLCAGNQSRMAYEDVLCAGAFAYYLSQTIESELSDSSLAAKNLFELHKDNIFELLKNCEHPRKLLEAGLKSDIEFCLKTDIFEIIPIFESNSIKKISI